MTESTNLLKEVNVVGGTGNPVQMQDIMLLWSAILDLAKGNNPTDDNRPTTFIASGIMSETGVDGDLLKPGVLVYNNVPYFLSINVATQGDYLYVQQKPSTLRNYENGSQHNVYTDYVVNASASNTETTLGILVGQANLSNLMEWRRNALFIPPQTITGGSDGMIQRGTITGGGNGNIKPLTITGGSAQGNIAASTINEYNIVPRSITGSSIAVASIEGGGGGNIATGTIDAYNLASYSITEPKLASDAVSSRVIAANAITSGKFSPGLFPGNFAVMGSPSSVTQIRPWAYVISRALVENTTYTLTPVSEKYVGAVTYFSITNVATNNIIVTFKDNPSNTTVAFTISPNKDLFVAAVVKRFSADAMNWDIMAFDGHMATYSPAP